MFGFLLIWYAVLTFSNRVSSRHVQWMSARDALFTCAFDYIHLLFVEEEQRTAEKEQMRQEEARKAKTELRQRKREEYAKSKQERARQEMQHEQEG